MAKVRSPLHSIDLRGRIADGFVFTVWRGINCLRTFVMPSQPRTQRKEQVWKTTPRVTRAWGGITEQERASWEAFARLLKPTDPTLGRESHWSGYNAYVSVNQVIADAGLPLAIQPPAIPQPNPPERFRLRNPAPEVVRIRWEPLALRHPHRPSGSTRPKPPAKLTPPNSGTWFTPTEPQASTSSPESLREPGWR